jgi:hypothetical protein
MFKKVILLYCVWAFSINISAQEAQNNQIDSEGVAISDTSTDSDPFFRPGGIRAAFYLGAFKSADEPQFKGLRAQYSLGAGLSADLNKIPYLALDLEFFGFHREFDTTVNAPLFGTIDNDMSADTFAMLFGARAFYPVESSFRIYACAGFGYFKTTLLATGSTLGLPGNMEESSSSLELYYGAGISYNFNPWALSLDYRRVNLDASFGSFYVDNADLGGDALMIGFSYSFL